MAEFDLKNITEVYVGNIYMIERLSTEVINTAKNINLTDMSGLCFSVIAKKDAILIKVTDNYYIDLDSISSKNDIEIINSLIKNKDYNNNILLRVGSIDPYIGELYIRKLKKYQKNKNIKPYLNKILIKQKLL